jgi:hypothetical protein
MALLKACGSPHTLAQERGDIMTRSLKTLVLLTALLAMTLSASAALIDPPTNVLLSDLEPGEGTITLGGLTFSDFKANVVLPGSPDLDNIVISLLQNPAFPNIVSADFGGVWLATTGKTRDTGLTFLVTADPGVSLLGVSLSMIGGSVTENAQISIVENIYDVEGGTQLSSLFTLDDLTSPPAILYDLDTFEAQDSIWIYKDIAAVGSDGRAHLSGFGQSFQTDVPEPATMSLLAIGGLAMLKRRRKK